MEKDEIDGTPNIPTLIWWWGLFGRRNPKGNADSSTPTGKVSRVGQVKGDGPDEKGFLGVGRETKLNP
jgi:hypothetical protein